MENVKIENKENLKKLSKLFDLGVIDASGNYIDKGMYQIIVLKTIAFSKFIYINIHMLYFCCILILLTTWVLIYIYIWRFNKVKIKLIKFWYI